jgi:hypothetical protein
LTTMILKTNMIFVFIFFQKQIIFYSIFSNFISQSSTSKFAHKIKIEF